MKTQKMMAVFLLPLLSFSCMGISLAEPLHYNVIKLEEAIEKEWPQDVLEVVLSVEQSGKKRESVSNAVTARSNRVLQMAKKYPTIQVQLGSRNAYPSHYGTKEKDRVWRDKVSILAKSSNTQALTEFIAAVQSDAMVQNMRYTLSDKAYQQKSDGLIEEGIARFRHKAQVITRAMGGKSYKIISLDLGRSGVNPMYVSARYSMKAKSESAEQMTIEPGMEKVRLNILGSIQVQ